MKLALIAFFFVSPAFAGTLIDCTFSDGADQMALVEQNTDGSLVLKEMYAGGDFGSRGLTAEEFASGRIALSKNYSPKWGDNVLVHETDGSWTLSIDGKTVEKNVCR